MDYIKEEEWLRYLALRKERPDDFRGSEQLKLIFDEQLVCDFVEKTGKRIGVVYESPFHLLLVDLVENPQGKRFAYERVLQTVQRGGVVMLTKFQNQYVLLNQYRHAIQATQYGFPRGFGEANLSIEENGKKELQEELDAEVEQVEYLGKVYADSGTLGGEVSVLECEVSKWKKKIGYEGILDVAVLKQEEFDALIRNGRITDGFTLAAYALYRAKGKE